MNYNKFYVELGSYSTCIHHFGKDMSRPCVILIHGAIENARIFFSQSGKGFAPWLATQGFDVYAVDLPGKGESIPSVSRRFHYSQTQFITVDMPKIVSEILRKNHSGKLFFGAHSWGGVLIPAMLCRHSFKVNAMAFFGSKRRISGYSPRRLFMVDVVWSAAGTLATNLFGYLPAKRMGMGSDNEPQQFYKQMNQWVYSRHWKDEEDQFDYHSALAKTTMPPTLFMAGIADKVLGNPVDVELLMNEMPYPEHELIILGKNFGNMNNYGHVNMLTHPDAPEDHFPLIADWFYQFI